MPGKQGFGREDVPGVVIEGADEVVRSHQGHVQESQKERSADGEAGAAPPRPGTGTGLRIGQLDPAGLAGAVGDQHRGPRTRLRQRVSCHGLGPGQAHVLPGVPEKRG